MSIFNSIKLNYAKDQLEKKRKEFDELMREKVEQKNEQSAARAEQDAMYHEERNRLIDEAIEKQRINDEGLENKLQSLKEHQLNQARIKEDYRKKAIATDAAYKKNLTKIATKKLDVNEPQTVQERAKLTKLGQVEQAKIEKKVAAKSQDHFNHQTAGGGGYIEAAEYALDRDRRFNAHNESMQDAAREQKDRDVRERIEAQIEYDKAAYAIDQNYKIQSLTGNLRSDEINEHHAKRSEAALRIHNADEKLKARGLEVDCSQGSKPEIKTYQSPAHHEIDAIYNMAERNADKNNEQHQQALKQLKQDGHEIKKAIDEDKVDTSKSYDSMKSPKDAMMASAQRQAVDKDEAVDHQQIVKAVEKRSQSKLVAKDVNTNNQSSRAADKARDMQQKVEAARQEAARRAQQQKTKGLGV